MEAILQKYQGQLPTADLLIELVAEIRPPRASQQQQAVNAIQALCHLLHREAAYADLLRLSVMTLLGQRKPVSLFVDSGIQPNTGFFSEMRRRIGHKLLPEDLNPLYLKDLFSSIFTHTSDELWVQAVPDAVWLELVEAIAFSHSPVELQQQSLQGLMDAAQVLSYRLSASGLEPELLRNYPELEDHASPFITQNVELKSYLENSDQHQDALKHILVMLDQCQQVIAKIRRNSSQTGTSINLTFLLQRMTQQIKRLTILLAMIDRLKAGQSCNDLAVMLFKTLVMAECHKNDVGQHWRENMELLALRVTENASRTGEHYITETRSEYFALMRSAMGAGLIVGIMAMIKIITAGKHYAPLTEAIFFSLNYGLGFVLIHMLHFTVATKQPAMTAAAIAATIDAGDGKTKDLNKLVKIIAQTIRSQTIAIIGNVSMAVPMAMLIAWLVFTFTGQHFVSVDKAHHLLADIDPIHSGALIYAGVAGVCLFLSGLIAGYHDNIAIYNRIPQRLKALGWLQKLLGKPRLERVANYVENNLGALAGNFYFGCLLGGMSGLGVLLGLPIDIRHIAFSSAFVGFSFFGLDFDINLHMVLLAVSGVLLIGTVNLLVSFSLALYVAMKSRKLSFAQWRQLIGLLLRQVLKQPRDFFLPPRKSAETNPDASGAGH